MERYPSRPLGGDRRGTRGPSRLCRAAFAASIVVAVCCSGADARAQQPIRTRPAPGAAAQQRPATRQAAVPAQPRVGAAAATPATAPPDDAPPAQPFQLTPDEQLELDQMLREWESRSEQITLFRCDLKRWEYDLVFKKNTTAVGDMKYKSPDRGLYRVRDEKTGDYLEDWRCDGQAIYEFNYAKKQVIERQLPPQMQGAAIANGPLPFIFGAKAETLKKRYFLRLKQPPKGHEDKICVEAYPKLQSDAANFQRAELLLTEEGMLPFALQLDLPNGKTTTVHQFFNIKTNDLVDKLIGDFDSPRTPPFWKRIVEPAGGAPVVNDPAQVTTVPDAPPQQATRPAQPPRR